MKNKQVHMGEDQLTAIAVDWYHRLQSDLIADREREAFAEWIEASPQNAFAFEEACSVWDELSEFEKELREQYAITGKSSEINGIQSSEGNISWLARWNARRAGLITAAATIILFAVAVITFNAPHGAVNTVATGIGELTSTTLVDGSVVHLSAKTEIVVNYSPSYRSILLSEGEALFEVAHDENRPFVVAAGGAKIRAVGTIFNVNRREDGGTVTVIDGAVRLTQLLSSAMGQALTKEIVKGEQAEYTESGEIAKVAIVNVNQATDWRNHTLIFDGQPLHQVVDEFNRFGASIVVIGDRELENLRISGTFNADDRETLIDSLEWVVGLRVVRVADYMTILYRVVEG